MVTGFVETLSGCLQSHWIIPKCLGCNEVDTMFGPVGGRLGFVELEFHRYKFYTFPAKVKLLEKANIELIRVKEGAAGAPHQACLTRTSDPLIG